MRKSVLAFMALLVAPAWVSAEPQRIEDTRPPCDNAKNSGKPPCDTKPKDIKVQKPTPTERDNVTVPPDIPAEGLPNQDENPSPDNSNTRSR